MYFLATVLDPHRRSRHKPIQRPDINHLQLLIAQLIVPPVFFRLFDIGFNARVMEFFPWSRL